MAHVLEVLGITTHHQIAGLLLFALVILCALALLVKMVVKGEFKWEL